jgi:16S rRNA (cytosine967-C5)-methyltransferase
MTSGDSSSGDRGGSARRPGRPGGSGGSGGSGRPGGKKPFPRKGGFGAGKPFGGPRRPFGDASRGFGGPRRDFDARPPRLRTDAELAEGNARALSFAALVRMASDPASRIADAFAAEGFESRLDARGRRFANELVVGIVRRRLTLDCVIAAYSRARISELDQECLAALRIGAYQLLYLDGVPPFAAIAETMHLVERLHPGVRGTVNGVLRQIDREANRIDPGLDRGGSSARKRLPISDRRVVYFARDVFCDPRESLALHLGQTESLPPFLIQRWLARHGEAATRDLIAASNRKPRVAGRTNRLKIARGELLSRLASEDVLCAAGERDEAIDFAAPASEIVRSKCFEQGLFYLQDETAMKVAPRVAPRRGERILDLCAAPGGKATHLAELADDAATIVAADADRSRLPQILENATRLGITSITPLWLDLLDDKREEPLPPILREPFDAVLLDVPCSNSGVLARRLEVRWRLAEDQIRRLADRGRELFRRSVERVRPGGRIVYSTCSIEPEENAENTTRIQVANPQVRLVATEETLPGARHDGGFLAVFEVSP